MSPSSPRTDQPPTSRRPAPADPTLFGALAVRQGFITSRQLRLCLAFQDQQFARGKNGAFIGQLLQRAGFLSEPQVDSLLTMQRASRACSR